MLNSSDTGAVSLENIQTQFKGQIIRPRDAGYESARKVWNGMIDRYPAMIMCPADAQDVAHAVAFARKQGLLISVRGGGHNVAGHATNDGGLVIDLSGMKQIAVDPVRRIARAEGGVTWGELDAAAQMYGLATPGGVFSRTGIAGLTLGGGLGWLRNKYGLSCDNLVAAEVVTASGDILRASELENRDLLWGLRGGGGNFGVVTAFEYQLHPVGPDIMMVFAFHRADSAEEMKRALRHYRDFCDSASDEVSTIMAFGQVPPDEHFPEALHRRPFTLMAGLYVGSVEEGRKALQPLLDFGDPLLDFSGVKPYVEAQQMFDNDYPDGLRYYWKSLNLSVMDEPAIERIVHHARQQQSPFSTTDIWYVGGAVKRGSSEHSAFFGRQSAFVLNPEANWIDPADDDRNLAWARTFVDEMVEFSDGSRYLNFPGFQEEGEDMMRKSFGSHYMKLVNLKRKYDPENLFRLNQNIKPT
ncbi:MAG: FAD-binding oxidoreductase [Anaerolineae bacterium]